jgi:hypothetical protein
LREDVKKQERIIQEKVAIKANIDLRGRQTQRSTININSKCNHLSINQWRRIDCFKCTTAQHITFIRSKD